MSSEAPVSGFTRSDSRPRARNGPGGVAFAGSVLLHGLLIAGALVSGHIKAKEEPVSPYRFIRVNLYSPPPQVAGEPSAPAPAPAIVKPKVAEVVPKAAAVKKPAVKTAAAKTSTAPKATPVPVAGRNPKAGSPGGEGLNVQMEGDAFPFPEYLENLIIQLNRYFRWTGAGNLEAHVGFYVLRDGSVKGIKLQRRSGNINFDLAALDAIEQAGRRSSFGPLPEGFKRDTLPVLFKFIPPN